MPFSCHLARYTVALLLSLLLSFCASSAAAAQSQEPKPSTSVGTPASATPTSTAPTDRPRTGVVDASWQGPTWGVQINWNPESWTVENELIDGAYEGLQLGTPDSTVFIEAYEGFSGNAEECLADAERELRERDNVSEAATLPGRPLPDSGPGRGPTQLFGIVAALPEGAVYRGVEYVECRTLVPNIAVLEITWQTTARHFNDELPLAGELFSTLMLPSKDQASPIPLPVSPPAKPNTMRG